MDTELQKYLDKIIDLANTLKLKSEDVFEALDNYGLLNPSHYGKITKNEYEKLRDIFLHVTPEEKK